MRDSGGGQDRPGCGDVGDGGSRDGNGDCRSGANAVESDRSRGAVGWCRSVRGHRAATWVLLPTLLVLVALAVGGGASAAGTAQGDPCAGIGNETAIVATPPTDAPVGPDGTLSVYEGSAVTVHLCQPENGTASLDASDRDWATVLDADVETVRLRIDGPTNDSLGTLASPEPVPGPALSIVDRSVESTLVNGSIPVASAEHRDALRDAEATYLERERALAVELENLSAATAAIENGSSVDGEPVAEIAAVRAEYRNASRQLRGVLYDVADSPVGGPRSATAIQSLGERTTALENRTREGLLDHDAALRDRQTSATRSLRLRIVGLVLVGSAIGAAVGAVLAVRRGRAARRRLARGDWATYSWRSITIPIGLGILLLALGVGWLVLVVPDALAEVTLP